MIRRTVVLSVVAGALAVGTLPSLAGSPSQLGPTTPPVPPLHTHYVCLVEGSQPDQGLCVWAPLPI